MYNELLNEAHLDRLCQALDNKRVLLVGNAATLFSSDSHGALIDQYDFVLRFGKGIPYKRWSKYLGTRTDAWFFGANRAGMYKYFNKAPFKIMTMSQIHAYTNSDTIAIPKICANGTLQPYRDFFLTGDLNYLKSVVLDVNGTLKNTPRLSQGVQAAHFLSTQIGTQSCLDFIGFDFFGAGFKYSYETDSTTPDGQRIPKEHPINSWHCPLTSSSYVGNPHQLDDVSNEETYIRSLKNSTVHQMPAEVDMERMQAVLTELRGKGHITNTF